MVSSRLLQAGIVIAAFLMMVTAFQASVIWLLYFFSEIFLKNTRDTGSFLLQSFLTYITLFLLSMLVLRKSANIADWLGEKAPFKNDIKINLRYTSIFAIILVAHSVFRITDLLPSLLTGLFNSFRSQVSDRGALSVFGEEQQPEANWVQMILKMGIYLAIIYAAKPLAKWFSQKFETSNEGFSFEDNTASKSVTDTPDEP